MVRCVCTPPQRTLSGCAVVAGPVETRRLWLGQTNGGIITCRQCNHGTEHTSRWSCGHSWLSHRCVHWFADIHCAGYIDPEYTRTSEFHRHSDVSLFSPLPLLLSCVCHQFGFLSALALQPPSQLHFRCRVACCLPICCTVLYPLPILFSLHCAVKDCVARFTRWD